MGAVYRSPSRTLGGKRASYASPPPVRPTMLMVVIFGFPGLALVTGFQSAPGEVFAGDRTTNTVIGVGLLAIAVFAVRALARKATLRVDEHDHGLFWFERGLGRKIFWDEIAEIRGAHVRRTAMSVDVARTSVYRLTLDAGTVLVVSNMLRGVERLMDRIEREVGERVLARARAALEEGATAAFGPILLTPEGPVLAGSKKLVPWSALTTAEVTDGTLTLRGDPADPTQRVDVPWANVPNAHALLALLAERRPQ